MKQWRRTMSILLALCMTLLLLPSMDLAAEEGTVIASGECGAEGSNVTWSLDSEGTLRIDGTGAMADYDYGYNPPPWRRYCIPLNDCSITSVEISLGITHIGAYAFYNMDGITSLTIPQGVTSIGEWAFEYTSITSITIPESITFIGEMAFAYTSITSITIPESVTSIGEKAFYHCDRLVTARIPASVKTIGKMAFDETILSTVYYAGDEEAWLSIGENSGHYDIIGPGTLRIWTDPYYPSGDSYLATVYYYNSYGQTRPIKGPCGRSAEYAFDGNTGTLTISGSGDMYDYSWDIYNGGMTAPWDGFSSAIDHIVISPGITSIGENAFKGSQLEDVEIPQGMRNTGKEAFAYCDRLVTVGIPASVETIGEYAFTDTALLAVYYEGDEEAWFAIGETSGNDDIGPGSLRAAPHSAIVYYNSYGQTRLIKGPCGKSAEYLEFRPIADLKMENWEMKLPRLQKRIVEGKNSEIGALNQAQMLGSSAPDMEYGAQDHAGNRKWSCIWLGRFGLNQF